MDENVVEFQTFLSELSEHYSGVKMRWLRMLLFGIIPIGTLDEKSALVLFNQLTERGLISKTDLKLLSDIAEVTMMALATKRIDKYKNTIQSSDTAGVGLTAYRRAMFNVLTNTDEDDLMTVIGFYKLRDYKYNNIWDVVYHIEKAGRLNSQDDVDTFAKRINQHAQSFLKGQVATNSNEDQGMRKEGKSETDEKVSTTFKEEQGKRREYNDSASRRNRKSVFVTFFKRFGLKKSDSRQVATSSNEKQGMPKDVKSETEQVTTSYIGPNKEQGMREEVKPETGQVATSSRHNEQGIRKEVKSETDKIEEYLLQRQKKLCSQASIFTPETMRDRYKVDISQMFTDLELLKEGDKNEGCKPTTLTEVVDVISSTPGCRALIDGEGGIGKTTILRHLSYNWATATQSIKAFEGKIVFLLSVRDLDKDDNISNLIVKQLDMEDFNLKTDLPEDPRLIKKFINKHDDKVVLLLDGLDELRFNNPSIISLFKKNNLEESTVILTSRSENIDEFVKESNVHVRVNGFNNKSIGKYIDKHFEYFEKSQLGKSLKKELDIDTYLETVRPTFMQLKHPEAYAMCKNPMLLLSLCILWEDNQSLPEDKTDLFKELFRSILNQFNKRENITKISEFEKTPVKYVNAMILLGKFMYDSLKVNQLSINKTDLTKHSNKAMVDMALKLGFVYEEAPISKSKFDNIFMPPHKLIVESLVGLYLCKLCESEGMENECSDVRTLLTPLDDDEWEVIRESEHLYRAREFAIGFLGDKAGGFLKHWVTNSLSTYRNLPRNLNFVKKQHKDAVVNELINHMTSKDFEINNHLDDISTSIRMLIDYISPGVQCDGHFIRLIMQLYCMRYDRDSVDVFCSKMARERKGRVIAHILGIEDKCDWVLIRNLSRDVFHDFVSECSLKQVQLALSHLTISGSNLHNIDVNSMSSLLIMCPKLRDLVMINCNLSADVIRHVSEKCSIRNITFYH
ncbi:uncharacterized protein [Antedon mediterranea]|uniref:uncharacterized protein isoform X1 n=1 Tax=Antedon mediterranea TaxID=105859 RepID=UPI003AF9227D